MAKVRLEMIPDMRCCITEGAIKECKRRDSVKSKVTGRVSRLLEVVRAVEYRKCQI
jgi:hypothetical protein